MDRYLHDRILEDLKQKMVFLTDPRQVGKTYLAKSLQSGFGRSAYLNNDDIDDAKIIKTRSWAPETRLIILDEIHKMKGWKNFVKGTFDTRRDNQSFLITGSTRLDTFRKTGESLAGRYYAYRFNTLSVKELSGIMKLSMH
jgi:predicted AAA+ superfamily ATPase